MRTGILRAAAGAIALAALLALSGCVEGERLPTLPPTPTATPIFDSEEEALAAAEKLYHEYTDAVGAVVMGGGMDAELVRPYVTDERFQRELEGAEFYRARGFRASAGAEVTRIELQQFSQDADSAEIVIYACLDVSGVVVFDSSGVDVTPPTRPSVVALEVQMVGESRDSLVIASSEEWADSSFC